MFTQRENKNRKFKPLRIKGSKNASIYVRPSQEIRIKISNSLLTDACHENLVVYTKGKFLEIIKVSNQESYSIVYLKQNQDINHLCKDNDVSLGDVIYYDSIKKDINVMSIIARNHFGHEEPSETLLVVDPQDHRIVLHPNQLLHIVFTTPNNIHLCETPNSNLTNNLTNLSYAISDNDFPENSIYIPEVLKVKNVSIQDNNEKNCHYWYYLSTTFFSQNNTSSSNGLYHFETLSYCSYAKPGETFSLKIFYISKKRKKNQRHNNIYKSSFARALENAKKYFLDFKTIQDKNHIVNPNKNEVITINAQTPYFIFIITAENKFPEINVSSLECNTNALKVCGEPLIRRKIHKKTNYYVHVISLYADKRPPNYDAELPVNLIVNGAKLSAYITWNSNTITGNATRIAAMDLKTQSTKVDYQNNPTISSVEIINVDSDDYLTNCEKIKIKDVVKKPPKTTKTTCYHDDYEYYGMSGWGGKYGYQTNINDHLKNATKTIDEEPKQNYTLTAQNNAILEPKEFESFTLNCDTFNIKVPIAYSTPDEIWSLNFINLAKNASLQLLQTKIEIVSNGTKRLQSFYIKMCQKGDIIDGKIGTVQLTFRDTTKNIYLYVNSKSVKDTKPQWQLLDNFVNEREETTVNYNHKESEFGVKTVANPSLDETKVFINSKNNKIQLLLNQEYQNAKIKIENEDGVINTIDSSAWPLMSGGHFQRYLFNINIDKFNNASFADVGRIIIDDPNKRTQTVKIILFETEENNNDDLDSDFSQEIQYPNSSNKFRISHQANYSQNIETTFLKDWPNKQQVIITPKQTLVLNTELSPDIFELSENTTDFSWQANFEQDESYFNKLSSVYFVKQAQNIVSTDKNIRGFFLPNQSPWSQSTYYFTKIISQQPKIDEMLGEILDATKECSLYLGNIAIHVKLKNKIVFTKRIGVHLVQEKTFNEPKKSLHKVCVCCCTILDGKKTTDFVIKNKSIDSFEVNLVNKTSTYYSLKHQWIPTLLPNFLEFEESKRDSHNYSDAFVFKFKEKTPATGVIVFKRNIWPHDYIMAKIECFKD